MPVGGPGGAALLSGAIRDGIPSPFVDDIGA